MAIDLLNNLQKEIHVHLQQIGGKKKTTTLTGIPEDEQKRILQKLKKQYNCGGSIDKTNGSVMLQGDYIDSIEEALKEFNEHSVIIHGQRRKQKN